MRARHGRFSRLRFGIDLVVAVVATMLGVVTLISREWIEIVFRFDPDHGSGVLEWATALGLFAVATAAALAAHLDWRRPRMTQA